jgi:beta-phosphoglucomutase
MADEPYAVIWDVDGTLVDTGELHFEAWVKMSDQLGRPYTRDDFTVTFGRRNPEIMKFLFGDRFSDDEIDRLGEEKERLYRQEAERGIDLLPGVGQLLNGLHESGIRQAIGSSAPRGNLELILRLTKSAHYFGAVVGMEDTKRGKPDPEVFLAAAGKLGVKPERCIVFEDAIAGVQAAKAGGMQCVGVTFVGHHPEDQLRAAGADRIVKSFEELAVSDVLAMLGRSG